MHSRTSLSLLIGSSILLSCPASAQLGGLLDRVKRKADEAAAEARDLRRDAEATVDVEGRADAQVEQALADAERIVPTEQRIENRVTNEIDSTAVVTGAREIAHEVNVVATTDERAQATVQSEVRQTQAEIEHATDIEGRARSAVSQSEVAGAVREAEIAVDTVTTADERAAAQLRRDVESTERSIENAATSFDPR